MPGLWDNTRTFAETQLITARDTTGNTALRVQGTATPQGGSSNTNTTGEQDPDSAGYVVGGHTLGTPLAWIFVLLVLFVVARGIIEATRKTAGEGNFSELKISVWNMFAVSLYAIPGIVILKTLSIKYLDQNNPLRRLVSAV